MALNKQASQLRKKWESKSDRISLRWKELVWHFHSECWGTLKQCWFDVMVGSYCHVEKVVVFTPASLDKLLKHSMEQVEELGPERRWVGTVTPHKNKSNAPRCTPLLLSHCSVCFAFNVLEKTEGPLAIASAEESKQQKKIARRSGQQQRGIWEAEFCNGTFNQNHRLTQSDCWRFLAVRTESFFDRMSHSHADGMCGFAAIQIDGHSLVCN